MSLWPLSLSPTVLTVGHTGMTNHSSLFKACWERQRFKLLVRSHLPGNAINEDAGKRKSSADI